MLLGVIVAIPGDLATQNWEFKVTVSNVKQLHTKLKLTLTVFYKQLWVNGCHMYSTQAFSPQHFVACLQYVTNAGVRRLQLIYESRQLWHGEPTTYTSDTSYASRLWSPEYCSGHLFWCGTSTELYRMRLKARTCCSWGQISAWIVWCQNPTHKEGWQQLACHDVLVGG